MKLFLTLLFLGFFSLSFSQSIKKDFENSDFDELIKNKINDDQLTAEELYYVGYAFFRKEDDKTALEFYERSLNKGFDNPIIYFQKGHSEIYLSKFEDAVKSYDIAISNLPKAEFYIEKGRAYKL
ncbi:hypothetical protein [Chryseobacterium sp. MP_3.2]|uniref:hypothetical protein n=1 Tax=Chryseobacterium sp. MP_3.2 TaxID=3071712 RepID=UPI002DFF80F7|nr:tetratricopeptide (TPR) repeat protein [Chryseobacterium sp. MP_3.2]